MRSVIEKLEGRRLLAAVVGELYGVVNGRIHVITEPYGNSADQAAYLYRGETPTAEFDVRVDSRADRPDLYVPVDRANVHFDFDAVGTAGEAGAQAADGYALPLEAHVPSRADTQSFEESDTFHHYVGNGIRDGFYEYVKHPDGPFNGNFYFGRADELHGNPERFESDPAGSAVFGELPSGVYDVPVPALPFYDGNNSGMIVVADGSPVPDAGTRQTFEVQTAPDGTLRLVGEADDGVYELRPNSQDGRDAWHHLTHEAAGTEPTLQTVRVAVPPGTVPVTSRDGRTVTFVDEDDFLFDDGTPVFG